MFKLFSDQSRKIKIADGDNGTKASLRSETKHSLYLLILLVVSLLLLLSLFGAAGSWGNFIYQMLRLLAGSVGKLMPFIFLGFTYALLRPNFRLSPHHFLGAGLIVVGLTGLWHSGINLDLAWQLAGQGSGGGYLGYLSFTSFYKVIGWWPTLGVLLALIVAGCLILFETTLRGLFSPLVYVGKGFNSFWRGRRQTTSIGKISETDDNELTTEKSVLVVKKIKDLVPVLKIKRPQTDGSPIQESLPNLKAVKPVVDVPIDLLTKVSSEPNSGDIEAHKEIVQKTFANFGIEVEMGEVSIGPTVTQYTLKPAEGVKLSHITSLSNDLSLALAAHPIRIEAPIPGKALVGIEVPNQAVAIVSLREILTSETFRKRRSNLTVALGKDVSGRAWIADVETMPHMLIAGATGSGKSVCINSMLVSLLYTNSPEDLKLIIVDPKRVEMSSYNNLPHLLTPVITEIDKTISALKWVVSEMDRRYQVLAQAGKRNIQAYNQNGGQMPYILVVIDELADLMAVAANEVEVAIIRLAQMARAVGIHLVVATQRPSVDVITGLIKANITHRLAFSVASSVDSRTILDISGAEKLLGRGDCLYLAPQLSKPKRLQGVLVTDEEINRVVAYWKDKAEAVFDPQVVAKAGLSGGSLGAVDDDLFTEAKMLVVRTGKASASFLQRRLRVGYARAARLIDLLEQAGVVGPGEGAKPREVLLGPESLLSDSDGLVGQSDEENIDDLSSADMPEQDLGDDEEEQQQEKI